MSLYPEGHPPFTLRGVVAEEEMTVEGIRLIAHERSLHTCLNGAYTDLMMSRHYLETLRAHLFRAEQLIETQPLPARNLFILLAHDTPAMLETLKAAQKCVEEWFESETCKRILTKYPKRPRSRPTSQHTTE